MEKPCKYKEKLSQDRGVKMNLLCLELIEEKNRGRSGCRGRETPDHRGLCQPW